MTYSQISDFTFVNFSWMHRVIKRNGIIIYLLYPFHLLVPPGLTNRIDFSKPAFMIGYGILTALELGIDIFSPR